MGAKAWFIAYFDDDPKSVLASLPDLDRDASRELAKHLFPHKKFTLKGDRTLQFLNPWGRQILVGCYGGLRIVAHKELGNDYPSKIDSRWYDPSLGNSAYVHAMHSVVDWFAFGLWRDGQLVRSLSISPDDGIMEQVGDPLPFEKPYFNGEHPLEREPDEEPYPLPFHPLELAEASLLHHLGFQFEGMDFNDWVCDPAEIPIAKFTWPLWQFW